MNIKQLVIATILLLSSGAYGQSEFDEAKLLAEQGDAASQFNIGLLHSKQLVTEASPEQAVKWYLRAANNNHTHAQFNLGIKYDKGQTLNYLSKLKRLPISVIQRLYYLKGGARTHKV